MIDREYIYLLCFIAFITFIVCITDSYDKQVKSDNEVKKIELQLQSSKEETKRLELLKR
jgi:hypothetical protein